MNEAPQKMEWVLLKETSAADRRVVFDGLVSLLKETLLGEDRLVAKVTASRCLETVGYRNGVVYRAYVGEQTITIKSEADPVLRARGIELAANA